MSAPTSRLRHMSAGVRLGITALLVVMIIGMIASAAHLVNHHENRDEEAGLSVVDLQGAYHGVERPSSLRRSLEEGHPETLDAVERQVLLSWLASDRISENYDNLDLGDASPAEIIGRACLDCHSRDAAGPDAPADPPLEYWDDIRAVAFSMEIAPTPVEILTLSTHTHALGLAPLTIVLILLLAATRLPRAFTALLSALLGLSLLGDIGGWWLTRQVPAALYLVIGCGAVYAVVTVLVCALTIADCWLPKARDVAGD